MAAWDLTIPKKTEQSIGQPKQDVPNPPKPYNPVFDQNAPTFETLKSALIAASSMLGDPTGTTPGSFAATHPNIIGTYGAVADAFIWNGSALVPNPTPTNIAPMMQAAANVGGYCEFPGARGTPGDPDYCSGHYYLEIPTNAPAAVHVLRTVHWVFGDGAILWVHGNAIGPLSRMAIMIEPAPGLDASGTIIEGVDFQPFNGEYRPGFLFQQVGLGYIALHAPFCRIAPRAVDGGGKWGIIVESGFAENLEASSYLATGSYINANFWDVRGYQGHAYFSACGTQPIPGNPYVYDPVGGAGLYVHGPDSVGAASALFGTYCNALLDYQALNILAANGCYGEFNLTFGHFAGASQAIIYNSGSEDLNVPVSGGAGYMTIGGTVPGAFPHIGAGMATSFQSADDGAKQLFAETAYAPLDAYDLWWRTVHGGSSTPPFWMRQHAIGLTGAMMRFSLWNNGHTIPGWDPNENAINLTDHDNPRGPNLLSMGRPTLNSNKRFSWAQAATIPHNGSLVVKMGQAWANKITLLATDPSMYDPGNGLEGAHTRVSAQVEIASTDPTPTFQYANNAAGDAAMATNLALLSASKVRVGATMRLGQDKTGGIWAVQIFNDDGSDVNVTVWWTAEMVQYATAGAGP